MSLVSLGVTRRRRKVCRSSPWFGSTSSQLTNHGWCTFRRCTFARSPRAWQSRSEDSCHEEGRNFRETRASNLTQGIGEESCPTSNQEPCRPQLFFSPQDCETVEGCASVCRAANDLSRSPTTRGGRCNDAGIVHAVSPSQGREQQRRASAAARDSVRTAPACPQKANTDMDRHRHRYTPTGLQRGSVRGTGNTSHG